MLEAKMKPEILVVDDEESLRIVLSGVLEDEGYKVVLAETGEDALEEFKKSHFKLVISDIVMPGISGIELLQEIKTLNPDTQVVIITSQASLETAISSIRAGAYDYLIKPFEDLDLISTVANRAVEKIVLLEENRNLLNELQIKNEELSRVNDFLEGLAYHDGLTELCNHRCFQEALSKEIFRSKRHHLQFSLIFMDVDYFKKYNDSHGHPAGDQILKTLAQLISKRLRVSDCVARYGGEEFIAILTETCKESAKHVAESICKIIYGHPFPGQESQPGGILTISIGVASFPEDGEDGTTLIDKADKALYQAKLKGRNCVYISGD